MKLYGETRELLKHTEPGKVYEALLAIISLISGCFAISVVPFIRKDFGERYQVEGFTKQGDIKLTNGFVIPKNYGGLTHGYPAQVLTEIAAVNQ